MGSIIFQAVIFALLASALIVAGLRGLILKRPFIMSRRWIAMMIVLGQMMTILSLTSSVASPIGMVGTTYPVGRFAAVFLIGSQVALWGFLLWAFRGYLVFGASGEGLHDILRRALSRQALPYEESARAFRLLTINNDLLAKPTAIDGLSMVYFKRPGDHRTLRRLAAEIKDLVRDAPVQNKRRSSYTLLAIGGGILLLGSISTYALFSIRADIQALEKANPEFYKSPEK